MLCEKKKKKMLIETTTGNATLTQLALIRNRYDAIFIYILVMQLVTTIAVFSVGIDIMNRLRPAYEYMRNAYSMVHLALQSVREDMKKLLWFLGEDSEDSATTPEEGEGEEEEEEEDEEDGDTHTDEADQVVRRNIQTPMWTDDDQCK